MFSKIKNYFYKLFSKNEIVENKKRYCDFIYCGKEINGRPNKLFCSESCKKKHKYQKNKLKKQFE